MRRAAILLFVLAACGGRDGDRAPPTTIAPPPPLPPSLVAPGLRLPDTIAPLAYDLRLELDPEKESFHGHVEIRAKLVAAADHFWIHAHELAIERATFTLAGEPTTALARLDIAGDQMIALSFGKTVEPREVTIAFDYVGHTAHDEEGLFRQQQAGRWYLFSQGESVFARRIVPCFDEPRFKTPWTVTLVVPHDLVALANMPVAHDTARPDGRRELRFATTPAMPSYLLAVAVGPFEIVDVGAVGRSKLPARIAVLVGDRARVAAAASKLPAIVRETEGELDDALPLAKLDLVEVPHLFGAMENPGLVTIDAGALVGEPRRGGLGHFTRIATHELVHQWFGNLVTPAWWDDLWISEAIASWLGDRIAARLGAIDDVELSAATARQDALAADAEPDAKPLRRPITKNADPDDAFDAIAYDKGASVLATLDRALPKMLDALRDFVRHHRDGLATTDELLAALAAAAPAGASRDDALAMLRVYVERPGAPIVELALRCDPQPVVEAHARDGRVVPVCLRVGTASEARDVGCALVGDRRAIDVRVAAGCPTWVDGNAGVNYYEVVWQTGGPLGPLPPAGKLGKAEAIALGDDVAAAVDRDELAPPAALAALATLAARDDAYARLGALAIARAIDPLVGDAARGAWGSWLAARFAPSLAPATLLAGKPSPVEVALRDALGELVPATALPADTQRKVARAVDAQLARGRVEPTLVAFAAPVGGRALFDRVAQLAVAARDTAAREAAVDALGAFGADQAGRAVEFFVGSGDVPAGLAWSALAGYFARADTRDAAWRAVKPRLAELIARLPPDERTQLIDATAAACDAATRADVAAAFEPHVAAIANGKRTLDHALAAIDRCVARRARVDQAALAAALRP